jgi:broad specificity phosphatase PhoE
MFGVKPPVYLTSNKNYHRKRKSYKYYDRFPSAYQNPQDYDLRLILVRHAERVDTTLGEQWYEKVFGSAPSATTRVYQNPVLPQGLPRRLNTLLYVFDPPITRTGQRNSYYKGRELAGAGILVDSCYSSPACRSVLSANGILQGMNRTQVPIRIEPYLFEPMSWNLPLQELGDISPFMSSGDWIQNGYNVDRRYRRLNDYLNPLETEQDFLKRSQSLFQSIERHHGGRRSNVLLVGHAATPIIYSIIALRQQFDADSFGKQCAYIPFLHTVILERNARNRTWYIRPIMSFV